MITIKIAGLAVGIDNRYPHLEGLCAEYLTEEPPLFTVRATDEALDEEARVSDAPYPRGYLESVVVYREIARRLPAYSAFVFHGVALAVGEGAYLFTARSGVGKTTHTQLWLGEFPDAHILNGDKPVLRFIDGVPYACGTPWRGKEGYGKNEMLPLRGIAFVHRAKENTAQRTSGTAAVFPFLTQTYLPEDEESVVRITALADRILGSVPLAELHVNMEKEAAHVARRVLLGEMTEKAANSDRTEKVR